MVKLLLLKLIRLLNHICFEFMILSDVAYTCNSISISSGNMGFLPPVLISFNSCEMPPCWFAVKRFATKYYCEQIMFHRRMGLCQ